MPPSSKLQPKISPWQIYRCKYKYFCTRFCCLFPFFQPLMWANNINIWSLKTSSSCSTSVWWGAGPQTLVSEGKMRLMSRLRGKQWVWFRKRSVNMRKIERERGEGGGDEGGEVRTPFISPSRLQRWHRCCFDSISTSCLRRKRREEQMEEEEADSIHILILTACLYCFVCFCVC